MITEPVTGVDEASGIRRASVEEVYGQVLADLDAAEQRLGPSSDPTVAGLGAVHALRSRVLLYTGDWAGAEAAAEAVRSLDYALAPDFGDLFPDGARTPEDILRVVFTPADYNNIGYYYIGGSCGGGRGELEVSEDLVAAYDPADERLAWSVLRAGEDVCGTKYPSTIGGEDVHVIRYGEVLLNLAESLARQDRLAEAVDTYNLLRERAGVAPHTLGVDVTTRAEVVDAILHERRLELALEGDRWPDLVRTGRAAAVLGIPAYQTLYPIPQNEIDVARNLVQNPGY